MSTDASTTPEAPDASLLRWFDAPTPGQPDSGTLNPVYELLDRHIITGDADAPALTAADLQGTDVTLSYAESLDRVAKLAGGLRLFAVGPGVPVRIDSAVAPLASRLAVLAVQRIGGRAVLGDAQPELTIPVRIEALEPAGEESAEASNTVGRAEAHFALDHPQRRLLSRFEDTRVCDDSADIAVDALVRDARIEPAAVEPLSPTLVIEVDAEGHEITALQAALSAHSA